MKDLTSTDNLSEDELRLREELLKQHPHLESKMRTSRSLDTDSKRAADAMGSELPPKPIDPDDPFADMAEPVMAKATPLEDRAAKDPNLFPQMRVNPDESFLKQDVRERREQEELKKRVEKEVKEKASAVSTQPPEVQSFKPSGKQHPILAKLRASVGLTKREVPYEVEVGGIRYQLRALMREDMAAATTLAVSLSTNQTSYAANIENAVLAYAIQKMDGVPTTEVFSIDAKREDGSDYHGHERKTLAAYALFEFLQTAPNELVETLITYYQQEFPRVELLSKNNEMALCPAEDCSYTRVIEKGGQAFCPYHGEKLAAETSLPNPS